MKIRKTTSVSGYTAIGIVHWCPACEEVHQFAIESPNSSGAIWQWNGDTEKPTFTPSMLIRWGKQADPKCEVNGGICHYILTDGIINYCGDCTHAMAGQSVPLPDWPYAPGTYGGIEE